ncbi:molybdopterin oxidoreductase family protein [Candidimonas nitroreducens]|uniref:Nitrate reductase n=1 Tax=Candidimonas nitroreducens TaxID=683354 RepID=A0A225N1V0_9BURK|nr:molybdopterin oxidoreductase family protein [Candidimonas nitroreducens]OWT65841.1 nitrate reductase [Candidimonas nitroreducens]
MASTRDSITDIWGPRTPQAGPHWPARVDQNLLEDPDRWVQACCFLCSNGCGLDIGVKDDTPGGRIVGVRGCETDVVNRGRLGPKGMHSWVVNADPGRLTRPLIRRGAQLEPAGWDEAMGLIVRRIQQAKRLHTAGSIAFYSSGQLYAEENYTLSVIGKAGVGTLHMDGNTRLCTATAGAALKETFGADGQPGTYEDVDVTDCFLLVGHDMAATATVLWARVLDRRRAAEPSRMVVIDPRRTATAAEADIHIQPRLGTNVAVLNGLIQQLIERGHVDRAFVEAHTLGYDDLARTVAGYTPERVAGIARIPADQLRQAADLIGSSRMLLTTCLQGVYQSNQGTAAAVQVNNVNLVLGRIGRPGCGILQMNGQPTAQNNRESGTGGDLPGFRNFGNPRHLEEVARLWNVEPASLPNWGPPTHALQIFRYAETGSIRVLWIVGTNPAVSIPDLGRLRAILRRQGLFVIVQDAFMTETAKMADVVLPAAIWGEKTGCSTNVNRVVHLNRKAVEPPGEARSDLDIFLDFARRMDFRDKDGAPLIKWHDAEGAFNAWRECTRGRPCDYSGLSYAQLSQGSGVPWPVNERHPQGSTRYYTDLKFATDPDYCESFGHDLITGAAVTAQEYKARRPNGRAFLRPVEYVPPREEPDEEYPYFLSTGRVVYHFHTRTKTGRAPALRDAAPDAYIQVSEADARRLGIKPGDMLCVTSRRGAAQAPARVGDIEPGTLFMPFHYGYWDDPGRARAANELTLFDWDPVSKQPHFKYAAVKLAKVEGELLAQPDESKQAAVPPAAGGNEAGAGRTHIADYIGLLQASEERLAHGWEKLCASHPLAPDIGAQGALFLGWSRDNAAAIQAYAGKYGERLEGEPEALDQALLIQRRATAFGLLRDLQDLWLMANESTVSAAVLAQGARALGDHDLQRALQDIEARNERQRAWLLTRIRQAAPQTLAVPPADA